MIDLIEKNEKIEKLIADMCNVLSEHTDSVQIICTTMEPDGSTTLISNGEGNAHARKDACRSWLKQADKL